MHALSTRKCELLCDPPLVYAVTSDGLPAVSSRKEDVGKDCGLMANGRIS